MSTNYDEYHGSYAEPANQRLQEMFPDDGNKLGMATRLKGFLTNRLGVVVDLESEIRQQDRVSQRSFNQ